MTKAIERRRSSVLGNEDWRTRPWRFRHKDFLQHLFDHGFELAALSERSNNLLVEHSEVEAIAPSGLADLRATCVGLTKKLDSWYTEQCIGGKAKSSPGLSVEPGSQNNVFTNFESFEQAVGGAIHYWWFKLDTNNLYTSIQRRLEEPNPGASPPRGRDSIPIASEYQDLHDRIAANTTSLPSRADLASTSLHLAVNIVRSAPYFLEDDMGWLGPVRLYNPLSHAVDHLRKVESPQLQEAEEALKKLFMRLRSRC